MSVNWVRLPKFPSAIAGADRRLIDSTIFSGMVYEIIGDSIVIYTRDNGVLALPRESAKEFADELIDIVDMYDGAE